MEQISSRRNAIVTAFRAVAAGQALVHDRIMLDGSHLVKEGRRVGLAFETVAIAASKLARDPGLATLSAALDRDGARLVSVTDPIMDAISPVASPSAIVALAARPLVPLEAALASPPQLVLGLANLQNPGNVGAVIRAAEAGGATGVVTTGMTADPYGWKALRGAMGGTFRIPVATQIDPLALVAEARALGLAVLAAAARGGRTPYETDLTQPTLVLLGGEGAGLAIELVEEADATLSVPMRDSVDSLNVAAAAAVIVYEAFRQRCKNTPAAPRAAVRS